MCILRNLLPLKSVHTFKVDHLFYRDSFQDILRPFVALGNPPPASPPPPPPPTHPLIYLL